MVSLLGTTDPGWWSYDPALPQQPGIPFSTQLPCASHSFRKSVACSLTNWPRVVPTQHIKMSSSSGHEISLASCLQGHGAIRNLSNENATHIIVLNLPPSLPVVDKFLAPGYYHLSLSIILFNSLLLIFPYSRVVLMVVV